jgi:hypothetical protein
MWGRRAHDLRQVGADPLQVGTSGGNFGRVPMHGQGAELPTFDQGHGEDGVMEAKSSCPPTTAVTAWPPPP